MKTKNKKSNVGKVVAISAGLVALTAAGYFFLGSKAKKNRQAAKGWMIKMKGDVVEKLESMQDITKDKYDAIVDTASRAYGVAAGSKVELEKLAKELKSHWKAISSKAMQGKNKIAKKAKKVSARKAKTV